MAEFTMGSFSCHLCLIVFFLLAKSTLSPVYFIPISLVCVLPFCFRSSFLPFPWYICLRHFNHYIFFFYPHHMPVPVQSSLRDIFGSLRHSRFPLDVFVPRLFIARHSAHPSLHPHRVSQDQISTPLCMPHGHRPLKEPILLLNNITIIEGSYKPNFSSVLLYK